LCLESLATLALSRRVGDRIATTSIVVTVAAGIPGTRPGMTGREGEA
jgi:hypothetical protein